VRPPDKPLAPLTIFLRRLCRGTAISFEGSKEVPKTRRNAGGATGKPTSSTLAHLTHAADNSIGSTIDGSSFSGLLTRVEIGHIRIGLLGYGRSKSRGSGSPLIQRT